MADMWPSSVGGPHDAVHCVRWEHDASWPTDYFRLSQNDSNIKLDSGINSGSTNKNNSRVTLVTTEPGHLQSASAAPSAQPIKTPIKTDSKTLSVGVKRRAERSPDYDGSSPGGASLAAKRRRTVLHHGFHGARKLVTSLFNRKQEQPDAEEETSGDQEKTREVNSIPTVSFSFYKSHLSIGDGSDINGLTEQLDSMQFQDNKMSQNSRHLSNGRKQFNMDPKKGMEYLIEHNLVENTPHDVAAFMYTAQGLSKTAIGEYLGERNAFNQEALKSFVTLHEFSQTNLVQALRHFLWSFRLPGEAQKIDRMMEQFADRYCQLNPGVFSSTDACYILSFALIMLNTSLHNPNVKDKLTPEAFVAMNRGLQLDQELSQDLLLDLYGSIKREPLKIPEDETEDLMFTFFNPVKEGWLYKRGGRCKTWKRRWFILNDGCLYYFQYTTDKEPKGIVPLENVQIRVVCDRTKQNCFELFSTSADYVKACKMDSFGKVIEGNHKVFRISASTAEEQEGWIRCIRSAISDNPIYDLINKRQRRSRLPVPE